MKYGRISGIAVLLLLSCLAAGACTSTATTGGQAIEQSKEQAYNLARSQIQLAVTAYRVDHVGEPPPIIKSLKVTTGAGTKDANVFDMCAIVGMYGGLSSVPDGCARLSGAADDNFDNGGCSPAGTGHHYVWVVDAAGNVFSACDENLDGVLSGGELSDGIHENIWP